MAFDRNVFINCPFDHEYRAILRPLLFTTIYLGFVPRIALERLDSGQPRIQKLVSLISSSKFAIHDLSRLRAKKKGEFFRLNMPLELGIDFGCRTYGTSRFRRKKILILETEPYRYQAAISDLSGSDIKVHRNEPEEVVLAVRNWLNDEANLHATGASKIWSDFNEFMADNYLKLTARGFSPKDIRNVSMKELMKSMKKWIAANGKN